VNKIEAAAGKNRMNPVFMCNFRRYSDKRGGGVIRLECMIDRGRSVTWKEHNGGEKK